MQTKITKISVFPIHVNNVGKIVKRFFESNEILNEITLIT